MNLLVAPLEQSDQSLVAAFISAFNLRDLDGMLAALHPEVEFHPLRVLGVEKRYDGHAGVRTWFAQLAALEHEHRIVVSGFETTPAGVIAVGRLEIGDHATPAPFCANYSLRDWQIITAHHYMSTRATVESLGIGI